MNIQLSADNKVINGLWISPDGKPLTNMERLCIYSYCANGHDFHLWKYGDLSNIPADTAPGSVVLRDGNEILPQKEIFLQNGSLAAFSDWFRWELMRQIGGWYVDMDIICIRPHQFNDKVVFQKTATSYYNSNFIKFPKGHAVAEAMASACAHPNRVVPWDYVGRRWRKRGRSIWFWKNPHAQQGWGESGGPKGFTLAVSYFDMHRDAKPFFISDIIGGMNFDYLINGKLHRMNVLEKILDVSYAVHFLNETWRQRGMDKNGAYHPNSLFEVLKRRYLPECG